MAPAAPTYTLRTIAPDGSISTTWDPTAPPSPAWSRSYSPARLLATLTSIPRTLFLPSGTIPPGYLEFQAADSLQAFCSYVRGILALSSTLEGAGLSSPTTAVPASVAATILTFCLKDGAGLLGGLFFTWALSGAFDGEVKFYRLLADVSNDVGLTVELLAPHVATSHNSFLALTCAANVAKALCGVAAGATRVSISSHFSSGAGNVAEVQAKEHAQEAGVTLLGLVVGAVAAGWLNADRSRAYAVFFALTIVHVVANAYAVRSLRLRSLNRSRLAVVLREHLRPAAAVGSGGGARGAARLPPSTPPGSPFLPDAGHPVGQLAPRAVQRPSPGVVVAGWWGGGGCPAGCVRAHPAVRGRGGGRCVPPLCRRGGGPLVSIWAPPPHRPPGWGGGVPCGKRARPHLCCRVAGGCHRGGPAGHRRGGAAVQCDHRQ